MLPTRAASGMMIVSTLSTNVVSTEYLVGYPVELVYLQWHPFAQVDNTVTIDGPT